MNKSFAKTESKSLLIGSRFVLLTTSGFALAIVAALTSSSKAVLVKLIYQQAALTPLELLTLRLVLAAPLFTILAFAGKQPVRADSNGETRFSSWLLVAWLGFSGYYFASLTDFIGLTYISAGLERLVLFTYPTFVLLFESINKRALPSGKIILAVLICYLGLSLAFAHDLTLGTNLSATWKGVAWVVLSGFTFSLYYMSTNRGVYYFGVTRLTGLAGLTASLFTLIHFAISGGELTRILALTPDSWFLIAVMAIVCTVLPSLLLVKAITKIGPALTANIGALGPVITILLANVILGESMSGLQFLGMTAVIWGVSQMRPVKVKQEKDCKAVFKRKCRFDTSSNKPAHRLANQ
ncbi:DMT family transporter [Aliikangiella sp. G2MR2-5]|uniref:DMT family transporter n=1 Tax=Aliikangiella sp. G2MR2-5 TaxID=2788943 RepID=UPI0018AB768C|nr:DMT family transporter [Aliikangiella sp. G2MR2-5]